jgi:hypothetical protein
MGMFNAALGGCAPTPVGCKTTSTTCRQGETHPDIGNPTTTGTKLRFPGMTALANPLSTVAQLSTSPSQQDGLSVDLESSVIFLAARTTQIAGILLRLPQEVVAQAVVIFTRFWKGSEGGSLRRYGAQDVSAASLFLVAKLSSWQKAPRSIVNVFAYIDSLPSLFIDKDEIDSDEATSYYVSEGTYLARKTKLVKTEAALLRTLGFQTHVALPHPLCINYLQTLGVFGDEAAQHLSRRAWAHLNSALFSPQLLYLTHQPNALATAAIYLAAKEVKYKLPDGPWWEVFDTEREELGFLVVALLSMEAFLREEQQKWHGKRLPLTVDSVDTLLEESAGP